MLKRAGAVVIAIGLLDIAVGVFCLVNGMNYSSSVNICAIIGGIFLLRGSLRAASIVRWVAVFLLAVSAGVMLVWPFFQPADLTLTYFRVSPLSASFLLGAMAVFFALLIWVCRELGREPILAARAAAGRKTRDMRIPAVAGGGLGVALGTSVTLLLGGEWGSKAKSLAEQQLGKDYRYHVSSLSFTMNSHGTSVAGFVTAWNEREIRSVPVWWDDR